MTCMRARTSSNFGLLGPLAAELAALACLTYMRAWISLKFGQIQPLVSMVTDRVMMGKTVSPLFMPPTLKKWGAYWFRLVRSSVVIMISQKL